VLWQKLLAAAQQTRYAQLTIRFPDIAVRQPGLIALPITHSRVAAFSRLSPSSASKIDRGETMQMIEEEFRRHDEIQLLFAGFIGKNIYFPSRFVPEMKVEQTESYVFINSGYKTDTFNLVISKKFDSEDGRHTIAKVCEEFNAARLPAAWWTCEEVRDAYVSSTLEEQGFIEDEVDMGMVANLDDLPQDIQYPPNLKFRMANSFEEINEFGNIIASLFEPPDDFVLPFYQRVGELDNLENRPLRLFLGYVDNKPVCTSSIFLLRQTASLFDISTLQEYRNRGYGSAITHYTLSYAKKLGARFATLQAAPDGLNIYKRMGFKETCTFRIYSNKRRVLGY
jgi:ribosomal protein S18 acetylase RimI-like enzyme